jgi:hypothetical protein
MGQKAEQIYMIFLFIQLFHPIKVDQTNVLLGPKSQEE